MKNILVIALVAIAFLVACDEKETKPEGNIIAQVNDAYLMLEDLQSQYSLDEWSSMTTDEKRELVNQWKRLTLLSQAAESMGLDQKPALRTKIDNARMKVLANAVLALKIRNIDIPEEEAFEYYKQNYLSEETELKIQRIFVSTREKLQEAQNAIRGGMKFTEAAQTYSEEAIGKSGGWAGFKSKKDLGDRIWSELIKRNPWEYAVVQVDDGYLMILHYRSRKVPTQAADFDDVKSEIEEKLRVDKLKGETDDLIRQLEKEANIEINV